MDKKIEILKGRLNKLIEEVDNLLDPRVIELSQKLDKLIVIKQKEKLNASI